MAGVQQRVLPQVCLPPVMEIRCAGDLRNLKREDLKELKLKIGATNRVLRWSEGLQPTRSDGDMIRRSLPPFTTISIQNGCLEFAIVFKQHAANLIRSQPSIPVLYDVATMAKNIFKVRMRLNYEPVFH